MEITLLVLYSFLTIFIILLFYKLFGQRKYRLPPSPAVALPVLGHLHLLKQPLHRTFHRFSQTHGHIFSLKLGYHRVVVVSSPNLVEECFTKNDIVFSNRPHVLVDKYIGYNHTTMAGAPYGHHWRSLRRLGAQEVLSSVRLNAFSKMRENEIRRAVNNFCKGNEFLKVELRPKVFELVLNLIMRMLTGKCDEELGEKFQELVRVVFEYAQTSNPEDFLPFLLWIDYRGLKKKMADLGKKLDEFYESLLDDHRREKRNTIIGHLLTLQESEPEFYTDQTIKGFITNMVIAGTDTSVVTVEWAMSLLLNHPHIFEQAKLELDVQVGHNRLVEEQDIPALHCLRNILLETFRLFPAGPMGLPRESSSDCKLGGYDVPRGTILLVNAWAIHRDPEVWDDPMKFKPERFDGVEVEPHNLMPFGMGRRACPGSGLGQRMVSMALGSLIQCFEWERVGLEEVDLSEGVRLTMPKFKPLEVMCRPREVMVKVLQEK